MQLPVVTAQAARLACGMAAMATTVETSGADTVSDAPDFPQCGFSAQTVAALQHLGARFHYVNIFEDDEMRDALKRVSNWPTYPQLYVKGELVGGCDIAMQMYRSGELKQVLQAAGSISAG